MLAAGLVNVLCFASSPQASIMRALLWVGGVWILASCTSVLHWNVTLARVPTWRFRRNDFAKRRRFEALMLALWGLVSLSGSHQLEESDADEDDAVLSRCAPKPPQPRLTLKPHSGPGQSQEPKSAVEASPKDTLDLIASLTTRAPQRRHTISSVNEAATFLDTSRGECGQPKQRTSAIWYLDLTYEGAAMRKWLYAAWVYIVITVTILVPVRMAVAHHALKGEEPIHWAIDYIFGDVINVYYSESSLKCSVEVYLAYVQHAIRHYLSWEHLSVPELRLAIGEANTRLLIAIYWVVVVTLGIATVTLLSPRIEVDTRRKIFHATIVTMLLPTSFIDPCFCALALGLVLAIFLLLEVIRAGQVPPLSAAIGRFVAPYVDGRDLRGPMVVSHVFLLIGCAIPLWLSLSGLDRTVTGRWPGWEIEQDSRDIAMIAGVVCVGMGDAAASLIGRRYGRRKWPWIGGKSLEGSAAFAIAVMIGLMTAKVWLHLGGWNEGALDSYDMSGSGRSTNYWALQTAKALLCGCGSSFMEAVLTGANDNVVVPVALWLLVRGAGL